MLGSPVLREALPCTDRAYSSLRRLASHHSVLAAVAPPRPNPRCAAAFDSAPVPKAACGPGSHPETGLQGRVSLADIMSGRAAEGYRCNTELVGTELSRLRSGRSVASRFTATSTPPATSARSTTCSFWSGPESWTSARASTPGVAVLDMSDPAKPVRTATLSTLAMLTPHESLQVNQKRGLVAAVAGTPRSSARASSTSTTPRRTAGVRCSSRCRTSPASSATRAACRSTARPSTPATRRPAARLPPSTSPTRRCPGR